MSLGLVEAAYSRLVEFTLRPGLLMGYEPTLGPITEAEHIRCENYEKGRLLYERAKALGFYAEDDY